MPVQENAGLVVYNRLLLKILKKMEDFISAVRILLRNVIRVVTSTHSLIIETLYLRGFCFPAIRQGIREKHCISTLVTSSYRNLLFEQFAKVDRQQILSQTLEVGGRFVIG